MYHTEGSTMNLLSTNATTPNKIYQDHNDDECGHKCLVKSHRQLNCQECGLYIPQMKCGVQVYTLRDPKTSFYAEIELGDALDQMKTIMDINRVYNPKPNYLKYRRFVVDWMCEIGETIKLSFTTIHHATALMDTFFSRVKDMETSKEGKEFLQLVALTSIFISAKFCEKDSRGPTACNIAHLTRGQYSEKQILNCERDMLMVNHWLLHFATPADFLLLFLNQGVVYSNDEILEDRDSDIGEKVSIETAKYVKGYAEFFVDLCLQEYEFQKYDSHTIACAVILASRRVVKMRKVWNSEFDQLFDADRKEVELCAREIYKFYLASFPQNRSSDSSKKSSKSGRKSLKNEEKHKSRKSCNASKKKTEKTATIRQRSNSIKQHLCRIDSKPSTATKSRAYCKKPSIPERSKERVPMTRVASYCKGYSKTLREKSLNGSVDSPDKQLATGNSLYKNSSSKNKSSLRMYKATDIKRSGIPRPALYSNTRRNDSVSRNGKMDKKRSGKLNFSSSSLEKSSKISCNPNTSSYKKISQIASYSNMALSRDKRATGDILKKYRPSLKVKMSKSKIYSTIDTQNNLTRTNSSFRIINSKSRNPSQRKIADNSKNFRSMSNLKLAMNKPVTHHNSSMTRCKNSGGRLNIDSISHNRSYGRHYPDTLQ